MAKPLLLVYTDDFMKYDFGPSHPLRPERVELFHELIKSCGFIDGKTIKEVVPQPVKTEGPDAEKLKKTIELVHDHEYVDFIERIEATSGIDSMNEGRLYGLGQGDNPVFKDIYTASATHVNATLYSCDLVMDGSADTTFTPGGGFHHAMPRKASGFCVFNDVAIAAKYLVEKRNVKKVMYIDIDAHHADGVQWMLYNDPRILKVSIHQDPKTLFPGTGYVDETGEGKGTGYTVNIPVPPGTFDEAYIYAFHEIIPPLAKIYKPEVIIAQLGVDTHFSDPLTMIRLTSKSYSEIGKEYNKLLTELNDTKFVSVTGGGYDLVASAKSWTILLGEIVGLKIPQKVPASWIETCQKITGQKPNENMFDTESDTLDKFSKEIVMKIVKDTVSELKKNVFPRFGK